MNGVSMAISKSCCPMYNVCTSNKMDLIPNRLSNLPLPKISTKHMLKHRVMSPCASLRSQVPAVSGAVLLGAGFAGMASNKAREVVALAISTKGVIEGVLKSNPRYSIILGTAALLVAGRFLGDLMRTFAVLLDRPFSIGDTVQVGPLKGQITKMGLGKVSLVTKEDLHVELPTRWYYGQAIKNNSRATTVVPCSLLFDQVFLDELRLHWQAVVSKISFYIDDIEKVSVITDELVAMMKSNPNIYLEKDQPYCAVLGIEAHNVVLSLGYNLKQLNEDQLLYLAKQDVVLKAVEIIKKHGATLGGDHMGK